MEQAKVKWFSKEKGYGFLTDKDNKDYYFGVQDVIGADLPENGDIVDYETYIGRENKLSAKNVKIIKPKFPNFKKIHCDDCVFDVEPKLWHYGGSDYTELKTQYLCPHCGKSLLKTGGGFNLYAKTILAFFGFSTVIILFISWL